MTQLFETILQISLSTAAVIGVLLLLVPLWQKRYSAKWRKAIWFIIAVRLLMPFSLELPQTPVQMNVDLQAAPAWQANMVDNAIADEAPALATDNAMQTVNHTAQNNGAVVSDVTVAKEQQLSRGQLWALVWLIGVVLFLLAHGAQYAVFRRRVLCNAQPLLEQERLLQQASDGLKLRHYPSVLLSSKAQGPMLIGFMKSAIILPERIYNERELLLILRHELVHYQQHDLWYKLVLLLANAVHWFNPLVYLMNRQANRDVEQVCDDKVVANQDMDYRKAYSMTILQAMSSSRGIALSTYLSKDAQNSKKRFAEILYPQKYGRGVAMLLVVALLAVAASGCLQVGEKDTGMALYEKVEPWLPENAIHNPKEYNVEESLDGRQLHYTWAEEKVEKTAEQLDYEYERPWYYNRELMIITSADTGEILHYAYYGDMPDETARDLGKTPEEEEAEMRAYAEKFAHDFIKDGKTLEFGEGHESFSGGDNGNTYRYRFYESQNTIDNYRFELGVNCEYKSVSCFRKFYYNEEQQQQVFAWIEQQYADQMGEKFQISKVVPGRKIDTAQQVVDNRYQIVLADCVVNWQPKLTAQQQEKLDKLKQTNLQNYQTVTDFAQLTYVDVGYIQVDADIMEDGTLDFTNAEIYPDFTVWGANAVALDWDIERERWQMLWTAAGYANGYVEKQKDAMAFFGTTKGIVFPEYDYYATAAYLLKNCDERSEKWDGKTPFEMQIELPTQDDSNDYLTMQLDRVNGEWQVTGAWLEK